jgi:dihydroorotate dehydrogenase subfamily 1
VDLNRLGALVTKTITRELRDGNPLPRVAETRDGMLNAIGIPSKGVPYFLEHTLPEMARWTPPLVVSISAPTVEGFAELAAAMTVPGVAAIEANISCPNIEEDGRAFAMRAASTEAVMRRLREATDLPLWAKLTPNTGDIAEVAQAAEAEGADALVVANTILAMAIDLTSFKPRLGNHGRRRCGIHAGRRHRRAGRHRDVPASHGDAEHYRGAGRVLRRAQHQARRRPDRSTTSRRGRRSRSRMACPLISPTPF